MYLFPDYADMETPGKLKAFLADLYSGKLHREFHYGPDKVHHQTPSTYALDLAYLLLLSQMVVHVLSNVHCTRSMVYKSHL